MLSGLWTAVTPLFADVLAGIVPGGMTGMESVTKYAWLMVALGVSTLVRGGLETWAGVELYRRRARAATLMRAWAALAIVLAFVGAISTYLMQLEQFRVMGEKQGTAVPAGLGDVVGVISGIVALAWGCLFPVFTLIWFARASIRQEVRSWAAGAST